MENGKVGLLALLVLAILGVMGFRYLRDNYRNWGRTLAEEYHRIKPAAKAEGATVVRTTICRLVEPVIFTGVYVLAILAWVLVMLAAGLGPILTALSIAFPGAAFAYYAAVFGVRVSRKFTAKGE